MLMKVVSSSHVIGEELKEIFIDGQAIEIDTTNKTLRI